MICGLEESLSQKIKAHNEKSDKAKSAQLKSTEMIDTKKQILKPSEYGTFKDEMAPDVPAGQSHQALDPVDELTRALNTVSLDSQEDGELSTNADTVDQALNDLVDNDLCDLAWEGFFEEWIANATDQELRNYIEGNVDESHHSNASSTSGSQTTHSTCDDDIPLRQQHAWRGNKPSSGDQSKGLTTSRSNDDDDDGNSSTSSSNANDDNVSLLREQLEIHARIKHDEIKRSLQSIKSSESSSDVDQSNHQTPTYSNDDDDGDSSTSSSNAHDEPVPFPTTIFITPRQSDEQLRDARRIEIERMNRDFVALPDCTIV